VDYSAISTSPLGIVANIVGLINLVCFILVVVKMFQHNQTGLGIGTIVAACLCGIGGLIAFVVGWMKSSEWNLKTVMLVWTVALVIYLGLVGYISATLPPVVVPAT